jgi:large subunit ribosomal protein L22
MTITASQTYVRSSSQKLRDTADAVKKLDIAAMRAELSYMNKEPAKRILQTLDQAVANAAHNFGIDEKQLVLKKLQILQGPQYKRMRAVSRGQGHSILKRTSHIVIELATKENTEAKAKVDQMTAKAEMKTEAVTEANAEVKTQAPKKVTAKKETKATKVTKENSSKE